MEQRLTLLTSSATTKGQKPLNQDAVAAYIPTTQQFISKGALFAVADGISTSEVSHIASQTAVNALLNDYYATSELWSTKQSALKVISATNAWLHAQSMKMEGRFDLNKGYVCTLSALIIKSRTAYLMHCGDCRIYRLTSSESSSLEPLTADQRTYSAQQSYLANAMGLHPHLHMDFSEQSLDVGERYLIASDGLFDFVSDEQIAEVLRSTETEQCAEKLCQLAIEAESDDNISVVVVEVQQLPLAETSELDSIVLATPNGVKVGDKLDEFVLRKELHSGSRSRVFAATKGDDEQAHYAIKLLSQELSGELQAKESLLLEQWVGQRLNHRNLLGYSQFNAPSSLYAVSQYFDGVTLEQWRLDNPKPRLTEVRDVIFQVAAGLQAMHRNEMVHQDVRPANIMLNQHGLAVVIDFGAAKVAGIEERVKSDVQIKGTAQYSAPELFLGEVSSAQSDQFSLAVICYQLLTGHLPYGPVVARTSTTRQQQALRYVPIATYRDDIPEWVDRAIAKACEIKPHKRYLELALFTHDLTRPNPAFVGRNNLPVVEKNPVLFWQRCCLALFVMLLVAIAY